jgi:thiol-disulfide isomerase/thioredoxin
VAATLVAASSHFAAAETSRSFVMHGAPKPMTAIAFEDSEGRAQSLDDFKGKVIVLNVWATWCVPCRKEMPALDRLQATLGSPDFEVVPVSIDRGGIETVRKFYTEIGVHNVGMYVDPSGKALPAVKAVGLPTTLLVDRAGQEIGRIVGPAEWDSPDMVGFLRPIIAPPEDTPERHALRDEDTAASRDGTSRLVLAYRWLKSLFLK